MNNLPANLRILRTVRGISRRILVSELEKGKYFITEGAYATYEQGRVDPCIDTLIALSNFYNITIDELIK